MNKDNKPIISPSISSLSNYRVIEKIGQGGVSSVYKAFDEKLKRFVAIKIMHPFLSENLEHRQRFLQEAQVVAKLTHPNIVQIYDVVFSKEVEKPTYIVMELVSGKNLGEWIEENPIQDLPEVASMMVCQLLKALKHAHENQIIHRDIKLENIMVTKNGVMKILDFGMAKVKKDNSHFTQNGVLLGSFAYMPPELINGQEVGPQADLYAISVVFYCLVSGKFPFAGENISTLLYQITKSVPTKIQQYSKIIPDELAGIIHKGLSKEPKSRFSSAQAMYDAINLSLKRFNGHLDFDELEIFLKDPKKYKKTIETKLVSQMRKKLHQYEQAKDSVNAMVLSHRLGKTSKVTPKKRAVYRLSVCFCTLVIVMGVLWKAAKMGQNRLIAVIQPDYSQVPLALATSNFAAKEVEVLVPPAKNFAKSRKKNNVHINIWPFATVSMKGEIIAKNARSLSLYLKKGHHELVFTHPFAATKEEELFISKEGEKVEFQVELTKSKPSFLVINSNINADIYIDGQYKGDTYSSFKKPVLVKIPDKTHMIKKRVHIVKKGFEPIIIESNLVAGKTVKLNVFLEE